MQKHNIPSLTELHKRSIADLAWYWQAVSQDIGVHWDVKYNKVLDTSKGMPWTRWFVDGKTNIISSSVTKFANKTPDRIAYHFISESGKTSQVTYAKLDSEVNKLANGLLSIGIKKGDIVGIFMPMIQEAIIAILACAKIGAVQTVIFSGYSSESLQLRLLDCNAKALFVSDGFQRKGRDVSQKKIITDALMKTDVQKLIVVPYGNIDTYDEYDHISYHDLIAGKADTCQTQIMDSEDPLFILYTSGTTGKPKGVIHTHGGFSVFAGHQAAYLIDLTPKDTIFWSADIGWITGQVWNVYGMLMCGATAVLYDGALDYPDENKIWKILETYKATIFGISPTAVRQFKEKNINPQEIADLTHIKNIPTTGEPMDIDSWNWLFDKVGNKKIPIINLSGGTEIGGAMLSCLAGMSLKATTVGMPCPGIDVDIVDDKQQSITDQKGYLVIKSPWPAMTRGLHNDDERYLQTYWSKFKNVWFHGDYVSRDKDGLWYMLGRVDDLINVSGHRLSTAEIEQAAITHQKISDAAAIPINDDITGQAIVIFIVPKAQYKKEDLAEQIISHIAEKIGKVAKPKYVCTISELPKTRTGKIMRRVLKAKATGEQLGDISSLENPHVLDQIPRLV